MGGMRQAWIAGTVLFAATIAAPCAVEAGPPDEALKASVTIDAGHPGPTIHRYVFGQFAEFVGNVINDGIWVGPDSPIPNTRGFRNDIIAALRDIHVPLVRWPGGCYADIYQWRDGIGPPAQRPRRINTLWGGDIETNAVGTHEFFDFLSLIGADAYINGNIGSGSPREMADWVEYMMGDRPSSLVEERRRNGRAEPFPVAMFGIGNETWACGGNMRAEYSADLHKRYRTFIATPPYATIFDPDFLKPSMTIVASGGNGDDYAFTRVMMANAANQMDALTLHYYTTARGIMLNFGPATGFPESEWASTFRNARRIDELITKHSAIMDEFDPKRRIGLYVDEWGTWYDPTPGRRPAFLFQQNTIRDAIVAAITLNVFQRHAERVRMSSIAQVVNVLQAPILTQGAQMVLTPTYHVYRMYVPFQDATQLPVQVETGPYVMGDITLPALDVAAARSKDGRLVVAIANLDAHRAARIDTTVIGGGAKRAVGETLTGDTLDAYNDFGQPPRVVPVRREYAAKNGKLELEVAPRSVSVFELR